MSAPSAVLDFIEVVLFWLMTPIEFLLNGTIIHGRVHWKYISNEVKQLEENHMQNEIRIN